MIGKIRLFRVVEWGGVINEVNPALVVREEKLFFCRVQKENSEKNPEN